MRNRPQLPSPTAIPTFPDPDGYEWVPVISGLEAPVDIQNAGDGSGRLFIVEKRGRIRILQDNQILPTPFLDIQGEVDSQHSEQGLLGLAFHPDFAQKRPVLCQLHRPGVEILSSRASTSCQVTQTRLIQPAKWISCMLTNPMSITTAAAWHLDRTVIFTSGSAMVVQEAIH